MSAPKRFFVERIEPEVVLSGEEFRHARTVLRLKEGDELTLLDGGGAEYPAIVVKTEKGRMLLHVLERKSCDKEPATRVYLLCGALKGDKTELVVQKAVELGAEKIGVFSSKFCSTFWNENKTERLKRVSREAAKQCLRAHVPEVQYFPSFAEALSSAGGYRNKLIACEFLRQSERGLETFRGDSALVVGSEGGFSEEEYEAARAEGFCGISLGKRILRAETAAIAFLSIVLYQNGELS